MNQKKYQKLRDVIIKDNPRLKKRSKETFGVGEYPIRLADCLFAIEQDVNTGNLKDRVFDIFSVWDLKSNSLTSQGEETKSFLYSLLVDKK